MRTMNEGLPVLWSLVLNNFWMTVKIIVMVTILLIVIEYFELKYTGKIREKLIGSARARSSLPSHHILSGFLVKVKVR